MNLTAESYPAREVKRGYESGIAVAAGKWLKIETTPSGVEILKVKCPAGKAWIVNVNVSIKETDA